MILLNILVSSQQSRGDPSYIWTAMDRVRAGARLYFVDNIRKEEPSGGGGVDGSPAV